MPIHIPIDEAELRDLLDRILDKGLFCGMANLMVLGQTDLSRPDNRMSVSSVDMNTREYAGRQILEDQSHDMRPEPEKL